MSLYEENKNIMYKYGISPQKKYGQNFLIDDTVLENIVENANVNKNDLIIEIGPGLGNLTKKLANNAGHVIAIEIDSNMVKILNNELKDIDNLTILNEDVMEINLKDLINEYSDFSNVKVVANLPYYITTPIIMKLLEDELNIDLIEVMIQKEVADRICASPTGREYGAITVAINYYSNPEYLFTVKANCFLPAPAVDSAVIKLNVLDNPKFDIDKKFLFSVVKASFLMKRKTLVNSLGNAKINGIDKVKLQKILEELGIPLDIRAERLSLEEFVSIANKMYVRSKK